MCFVFISEQTATFAPHNINWLVIIIKMKSVYCTVQNWVFKWSSMCFNFKGLKWKGRTQTGMLLGLGVCLICTIFQPLTLILSSRPHVAWLTESLDFSLNLSDMSGTVRRSKNGCTVTSQNILFLRHTSNNTNITHDQSRSNTVLYYDLLWAVLTITNPLILHSHMPYAY
jgi:hypothetical protein